MDPALQRRVQRYGWDKAAAYYETFWQRQLEPAQTRLLQMANLQEGESVLDVACGTGLLSFRAAAMLGIRGTLFGTDISDRMIDIARGIATEKNLDHVRFERMDAENLEIADTSFDVALCSLGLMYVPDSRKAVEEMCRVLKRGGRALAAVWGPRKSCGWAEIFPIVDARVKSEVCPLFFQLGTGSTLEKVFEDAGFSAVSSERMNTLLQYATPEEACGAAFAGGPVALAYSRFDDTLRTEVHREYLASIEPFREGHGYAIPGEFVITKGDKV